MGTPAPEHPIDEDLARRLLQNQHPDLATLPISTADSGFDNVLFRLGDDFAVRLPRRAIGAELAASEHRWLPELAERLPLPVPVPVRIGAPALGYPWPWSVVRWVAGTSAEIAPVRDAHDGARKLAEFLRALHIPAPDDAPHNPWRGIPLTDRVERTLATIDGLRARGADLDLDEVAAAFERAARRPAWSGHPVWLHGDLHPRHVLTVDGQISGVIDFGDLTSGDPATDLAAVWMLLPLQGHEAFRSVYGPDDDTWERGRGWAIVFGAMLLEIGLNDGDQPRRHVAETTLLRAIEAP